LRRPKGPKSAEEIRTRWTTQTGEKGGKGITNIDSEFHGLSLTKFEDRRPGKVHRKGPILPLGGGWVPKWDQKKRQKKTLESPKGKKKRGTPLLTNISKRGGAHLFNRDLGDHLRPTKTTRLLGMREQADQEGTYDPNFLTSNLAVKGEACSEKRTGVITPAPTWWNWPP